MSREYILEQVQKNQPQFSPLPTIDIIPAITNEQLLSELKAKLEFLHVTVYEVNQYSEIKNIVVANTKEGGRLVTTIPELSDAANYIGSVEEDAHLLENVERAIIPSHFAVAENGAIWITDGLIQYRVLPFIAQQLAVVVHKSNIVANMHQAYDKIAGSYYNFGVFIAGPSKTADIEQSLVLGAHGPKGMMVFILD